MYATTIRRVSTATVLAALLLGTTACANMNQREKNAAIGGGIGAASGLAISALTNANPLVGAAIGGLGGAAVGALVTK